MENASKALIISAEILLGVLLLTLMVYAFHAMGSFSDTVDKNIETKTIAEFNTKFERFQNKNLTAQDVVTIINLAKQHNEKMETEAVTILLNGGKLPLNKYTEEKSNEFIQNNSFNSNNEIQYFTCTGMNYNKETGKIDQIVLKKLQ